MAPGAADSQGCLKLAFELDIGGVVFVIPVQYQHPFGPSGLLCQSRSRATAKLRPRPATRLRLRFDNVSHQRISLMPNCTCREDPDSPVGKRVFVIRPKSGCRRHFPAGQSLRG